jgi:hypothetical protein
MFCHHNSTIAKSAFLSLISQILCVMRMNLPITDLITIIKMEKMKEQS